MVKRYPMIWAFLLLVAGSLLGSACLESIQVDADKDGFTADQGDCDDTDPLINPDATEICDEIDNNCDGQVDELGDNAANVVYRDTDGDGYGDATDTDGTWSCNQNSGYANNNLDCDDSDADIMPTALEVCDRIDNNCDGQVDEGYDTDDDGYTVCSGDCDDSDATFNPGVDEICDDEFDSDCDGELDDMKDVDGDGFAYCEGDCDDNNAEIHPFTVENCMDGVDNNCNGFTDEDIDEDGDTFSTCSGDCYDADASINPFGEEICDGLDNDCDGEIDSGFDQDFDGYSSCLDDCDDSDASINPGATETCNEIDDNCDGEIDEGLTLSLHIDEDGDGFGSSYGDPVQSCTEIDGYVEDAQDCDDADPYILPNAIEVCDTKDNDCNGKIDDRFYQGTGISGQCGINSMLPSDGALAVPSGYQVVVDFDSLNPSAMDAQPYALTDPAYIWLTVEGTDGTVKKSNHQVQDLGAPQQDPAIPTRISWPGRLEVNPGVTYTMEVLECQNPCTDPGDGWIIKGRAVFSGQAPCGLPFNIKSGMAIEKMGNSTQMTLSGMNWDIANAEEQLAMYLLDLSPTATFPVSDLAVGQGPLEPPSPYSVSPSWGVPVVLDHAKINSDGWLETQRRDAALVVPMTAGTFVMFVEDAVISARVSMSGGTINAMTDYELTGLVHDYDMHKLLVDAGLEDFEPLIFYDIDSDDDGENDTATLLITAQPTYAGSMSGMSSECM